MRWWLIGGMHLLWVQILIGPLLSAVELELSQGRRQKGKLVYQDDKIIKLRIFDQYGQPQLVIYPIRGVVKIHPYDSLMDIYERRAQALHPGDLAAYYRLALWCQEHKIVTARKLLHYVAMAPSPWRGLALWRLAGGTVSQARRLRYLRLSLWYRPQDRKIYHEFLQALSKWEDLRYESLKLLGQAASLMRSGHAAASWKLLWRLGQQDITLRQELTLMLQHYLHMNLAQFSAAVFLACLPGNQVPCYFCRGKGSLNCSHCQGSGKIVCPLCHQTGKVSHAGVQITCPVCNGVGWVRCPHCPLRIIKGKYHGDFGTGQQVCPKCKGLGTIVKREHLRANSVCPLCQGTGGQRCPHCQGRGVIECPHCQGQGGHWVVCQEHQQPQFQTCLFCQGHGRLACTWCSPRRCWPHRKHSPYSYPMGTGWLCCPRCEGRGRKVLLRKQRRLQSTDRPILLKMSQVLQNPVRRTQTPLGKIPPLASYLPSLSWAGLLQRDSDIVFANGQWLSIARKAALTGKPITRATRLIFYRQQACPLDAQDLNFFLRLPRQEQLPAVCLPLYQTTFKYGHAGRQPWFTMRQGQIYLGLTCQKSQQCQLQVLVATPLISDLLKPKGHARRGDRVILYYRIRACHWQPVNQAKILQRSLRLYLNILGLELQVAGQRLTWPAD